MNSPLSPATSLFPVNQRLKGIDIFAIFNVFLFLVACAFVYYEKYVSPLGGGYLVESFLSGLVIVSCGLALWLFFRKYDFRLSILLLMELGILLHYGGAFVVAKGDRLYDLPLLGLPYDKYVHCINSFIAAAVVNHLFGELNYRLSRFRNLALVLIVLGLGAFYEISEYAVSTVIPFNGVGGYDNNMKDLVANLAGGLAFVLFASFRRRDPEAGEERQYREKR